MPNILMQDSKTCVLFALLGKFAKQVLWGPPSPITSSYADMHTIGTVLLHVYTVSLYSRNTDRNSSNKSKDEYVPQEYL
jgi:hypothetical protein